jgi:hypothetical protein
MSLSSVIYLCSFIMLVVVAGIMLGLPRDTVPLTAKIYLCTQVFWVISVWLANQQWSYFGKLYAEVYTYSVLPMLCALVVLTLQFCSSEKMLPAGLWAIFGVAAIFLITRKVFLMPNMTPRDNLAIWIGGLTTAVFISCGIALFLSIGEYQGPILENIKITLVLFWLIEGLLQFYILTLKTRGDDERAIRVHTVLPGLVAIFLFFYLAWSLSQVRVPELGRADSPESTPRALEN